MNTENEDKKIEPTATTNSATGPSIFLIDDDKFLLDMYSMKFSRAGLRVDVSTSAHDALDRFHAGFAPDIVVLDIIMPGMDGLELLTTMRKEKLVPHAVVVMLTNQADDNEKAKGMQVDGFIIKAMNIPSEVVTQVLEIFNKKKK